MTIFGECGTFKQKVERCEVISEPPVGGILE